MSDSIPPREYLWPDGTWRNVPAIETDDHARHLAAHQEYLLWVENSAQVRLEWQDAHPWQTIALHVRRRSRRLWRALRRRLPPAPRRLR